MKAITVKYLPATNTLGARLKVEAEGVKPLLESRDYYLKAHEQATDLAYRLASKYNWLTNSNVLLGGTLPNGDDVFVIHNIGEPK